MSVNNIENQALKFVKNAQSTRAISHFLCDDKMATWEDTHWFGEDSKGKMLRFYFVKPSSCIRLNPRNAALAERFPDVLEKLLKIYALVILTGNQSVLSKQQKFRAALVTFEKISSLNEITSDFLEAHTSSFNAPIPTHINVFINWLKENALISKFVKPFKPSRVEKVGIEVINSKKSKVPESKIITALGAIVHDTIKQDPNSWNTSPLVTQRDAMVCAMATLCMGSPNRAGAELPILQAQYLKTHQQQIDGELRTVSYLDWVGSKGYQDYSNHILSVVADKVDLAVRYIMAVTEPNRVLARFYATPNAPLRDILMTFQPSQKNASYISPELDKPTNLLALGVLLGFYDEQDKFVFVPKGNGERQSNHYYDKKPINEITNTDLVILSERTIRPLFQVKVKDPKMWFPNNVLTVKQMQDSWFDVIKQRHPKFPLMLTDAKKGQRDVRHAMFLFNGAQMNKGTGGRSSGSSPYQLTSLKGIGDIFKMELRGPIFARHNFEGSFKLKTHQFRHLLNDTGEKLDLPHETLNLWSGRKTPEQLMNYVHATESEKGNKITDILFKEDEQSQKQAAMTIRMHSIKEYNEKIANVATITSTGACVQQLAINPCRYFNDFETQCTLCSSQCHIAHDKDAIELLSKDLSHQEKRLQSVKANRRFQHSSAMHNWFKIHLINTEMLRQIIKVMSDKSIRKGSFIRLLKTNNEFRITDINKQTVTTLNLALPDAEKALSEAIENIDTKSDSDMTEVLGLIKGI